VVHKNTRSIQKLAINSVVLSAILSMTVLILFSFIWGDKLLTTHLKSSSEIHSNTMMAGMQALMTKGANSQEIKNFAQQLNELHPTMDITLETTSFIPLDKVEILRGKEVVKVIHPIRLEQHCINCHQTGLVNQQIGTITHIYPISELMFKFSDVVALLISFTALSFLLMFVLTYLYLRYWIIYPLKDLSSFIDQVNDHDKLESLDNPSNITEIENIRQAFNRLAKALTENYVQSVSASETDELTGVGNRRQLHEILNIQLFQAKQTEGSFVLLMLDLNRFKHINDTYGHQQGDEALRLFASVLKSVLRQNDYVFRLGGDEFIICLNNITSETIRVVNTKIRMKLQTSPLKIDGQSIQLSTSIGAVSYPEDGKNLADLMKAVDHNMYLDKQDFYKTQKNQ